MSEKRYGVIIEHKAEQPIITESKPMTYSQAISRMHHFLGDSRIIRVAVFEMRFAHGNETLIPEESEF